MGRARVRVNMAGLKAVMQQPKGRAVLRAKAEQIASLARAQGIEVEDVNGGPDEIALPVEVTEHEEGPAVVLAHPAGRNVQAKHGTLTKAAAAAGLDVRGS